MKKFIVFSLLFAIAMHSKAQDLSAKEKAEGLAAEFNKEKNKVKEKNGIVKEKHKKIEATPDIRTDEGGYAATYEMEGFNQFITLSKNDKGEWQADFTGKKDNEMINTGKLTDIKIESALLTGTLVLPDGSTKMFEAVFINRFVNGEPDKGLGFKQVLSLSNGMIVDKAYYKRKE
jgi:hypothetical protein